jgi:hypothetical protein
VAPFRCVGLVRWTSLAVWLSAFFVRRWAPLVVSRDRIPRPQQVHGATLQWRLRPDDRHWPDLVDELSRLVQQHAAAQHYQFSGGISITWPKFGPRWDRS